MAVDTNFASLVEKLKVEDPCLPPRSWESIPSESGPSHSADTQNPHPPLYHTPIVSEASLVRLVMNALQGMESALVAIEKIFVAFYSYPADRTFHRISSLWNRSSSTLALGQILKSIGQYGCIVLLLHKFVGHFSDCNVDETSSCNKLMHLEAEENHNDCQYQGECQQYSLVNHAFSVAVRKILEGYLCSLDTLPASVGFRRSLKAVDKASSRTSFEKGCFMSSMHSEITLLEVYLHTEELRTRIEAIGNICNICDVALCFTESSFEGLIDKAKLEFLNFPRGGDLLTYLYSQLRVADPVHSALLKFLFLHSCEPYCEFIRLWIFEAKISDPYNEFVVNFVENSPSYLPSEAGSSSDVLSATIKERDGVAVPCFLKDFLVPLSRAGQQLQVLTKLIELCSHAGSGNHTYKGILTHWNDFSSDYQSFASPLTFNKGTIEALVLARNNYYKKMLEKLDIILTKLEIRYQQGFCPLTMSKTLFHFQSIILLPASYRHLSDVYLPRQYLLSQVVSYDNKTIFSNGGNLSNAVPLLKDAYFVSPSANEKDLNTDVDEMESVASSTVHDVFTADDQSASSECSSQSDSEEQNESLKLWHLPNNLVTPEQTCLSDLTLLSSILIDNSSWKPSVGDPSNLIEGNYCEIYDRKDLDSLSEHPYCPEPNLGDHLWCYDSGQPYWSCFSETQDFDSQYDKGWMSSCGCHCHLDTRSGHDVTSHSSECGLKMLTGNTGVLEKVNLHLSNMILTENYVTKEINNNDQLSSRSLASPKLFTLQQWKVKYDSSLLSMNPLVSRNDLMRKQGERGHAYTAEPFPCFDFSSVKEPCKVYVENLTASSKNQFGADLPILSNPNASAAIGLSNYHSKECGDDQEILVEKNKSSHVKTLDLKNDEKEDVPLANVRGGSGWQSMLSSDNNANFSTGDGMKNLAAVFEMPLDYVIEKCLLQEILLQYWYVSKLTIKLLEEGFGLQEHLLALRRYHFMELADWADLFVMSLWHRKLYLAEADMKVSEIQGLLETSVQRSSCERDPFKDRLFVYMKKQRNRMMPLSTCRIGVNSFDLLGLGYRVDWPVGIILTPGALEIYAQIFNFLIRVKLAAFSLSDIWCSFKDLLHLTNQNRHSEVREPEMCRFNILVRLRHQINHFVSTLQQYVQSQLSHVSWFRFLDCLKHKVKDMVDLESVHMVYLTDSLHICFLSDEMQSISSIIESILQCALDFKSCLVGTRCAAELDGGLSDKLSQINISQVLAIKQTFDKNLKELHACYLKTPKNIEFGLTHFWHYLNYNEYYSDASDGISRYAFKV